MTSHTDNAGQKAIPSFNSDTERAEYLKSRGYEFHRAGKGGHQHWRHKDVYESAVARKVKLPQNLAGISTVEKTPGEITLSTGCKPYTWEGIVKQINWAAEEYVANDPAALSAERESRRAIMDELRKNIRSTQEERRSLSLQRRALCQAFKEGGMKGAVKYLENIGPELQKAEKRVNAGQIAIDILRQRAEGVRGAPGMA
jgi:hypothetical protein